MFDYNINVILIIGCILLSVRIIHDILNMLKNKLNHPRQGISSYESNVDYVLDMVLSSLLLLKCVLNFITHIQREKMGIISSTYDGIYITFLFLAFVCFFISFFIKGKK